MPVDRSIDPAYLAYQYGDAERLRVRRETHDRYSELPNDRVSARLHGVGG